MELQEIKKQLIELGNKCINDDFRNCIFCHDVNNSKILDEYANQFDGKPKEEFETLFKEYELFINRTVQNKLKALNESKVGKVHESITFVDGKLTCQLQVGHPSENGAVKGCFPVHLLKAIIELFKHYDNVLPCRETSLTITKLEEAFLWAKMREFDREERGVLQTDKK